MKRLFTAFPIRGNVQKDFLEIAHQNANIDGVRWTRPDNLHLTIFFIGEVEEEHVEKISELIKEKFTNIEFFDLEFSAIEVKQKNGKPSMIWGRFEKNESFSGLSKQIEELVKDFMTITPQHKDPVPHCTLARIKSYADIDKLDITFQRNIHLTVDHIELWMTVQEKDGVRYVRID